MIYYEKNIKLVIRDAKLIPDMNVPNPYAFCSYQAFASIEKEIKILQEENQKLKAQLEKAESVLKFYSDRFSYEWSNHPSLENYSAEVKNDSSLVKYKESDGEEFQNHCAGKRAREYFNQKDAI